MTLHEEFASVKAEAIALINTAKTANRDLTAEERESNDKRFARLDAIKAICLAESKAASYTLEQQNPAVEQFSKGARRASDQSRHDRQGFRLRQGHLRPRPPAGLRLDSKR